MAGARVSSFDLVEDVAVEPDSFAVENVVFAKKE
jgi:hypothetical protein